MAMSFGSAIGDKLQFSTGLGAGASRSLIIGGWFQPTTITSGRYLWAFGTNWRFGFNGGSGDLQMRTDAPTDGVTDFANSWSLNEWLHLVCIIETAGTSTNEVKLYRGTIDTRPVEVPGVVTIAASGTFTANTTLYVGNNTGTLAFQGQIADFRYIASTMSPDNQSQMSPGFSGSFGAVNPVEERLIYDHIILPWWRGEALADLGRLNIRAGSGGTTEALAVDLSGPATGVGEVYAHRLPNNVANTSVMNLSNSDSANATQEREPRSRIFLPPANQMSLPPLRRRA